ncbi:MAG: hypothetical protein AB7F35_12215 [Acetobacteraceae bacterium]
MALRKPRYNRHIDIPPDLLDVAASNLGFESTPLTVAQALADALIRGLDRQADTEKKDRFMCALCSDLLDRINGRVEVRMPEKAEPNPENTGGARGPGNNYNRTYNDRPRP